MDFRFPPRRGFTLIELSVVMALMGLLMAVAVVSLKDVCRAARIQYALEQVRIFERSARQRANLHRRSGTLTIHIDKNALQWSTLNREADEVSKTLRLGAALQVRRVRQGRRAIDSGRVVVPISDRGATSSYAIQLHGVDGSSRWFVFAGLTGQATELKDDSQVERMFDALASSGSRGS